jgi:ribosome-binding factor A
MGKQVRRQQDKGLGARREPTAGARPERRRADRVAGEIAKFLSDLLLRRTRDPRLAGVTITHVSISPDLRNARVYFTLLDETAEAREALRGFASAAPFLRRSVGENLGLRYAPELSFAYDEGLVGARRIDDLLRQVHRDPEPEGETTARDVGSAGSPEAEASTPARPPRGDRRA